MVFRSMSSDGVEYQFQAVSARNTQNEHYLPNPALRALFLPRQDMHVDARVSVEKRIVSKLTSLQYAINQSLEDWLLIVKILVVIGSVDGIHFSPMCFHCSYRPDVVVCALSFRPDWDSRSLTIISMPLTYCVGGCLCYSESQFDTCVCGVPISTWRQDPKDQQGTITHVLAIVKMTRSPLLYESIFPSIEPCILGSEPHVFLFGAVVGFIPKMSSQVHHQRSIPAREITKPITTFSRSLSKLEDCSPLAFFFTKKASQTSSCRGHERSFSTLLLIIGVNLSTSTPPHKRYLSPGLKASEHCHFPNHLISCVMVRLGPEDITRIIPMRLEVVEYSTSRHTVTISKSEDFEGRSIFSMRLLANGSFDINLDTL